MTSAARLRRRLRDRPADVPDALDEESQGQSCASAWTSCGREIVTAPVSAGSVRTRIAFISEVELPGPDPVEEARHRPEYVVDGDVEGPGASSWAPGRGPSELVADGSSSTGMRMVVASAAPVTMLVAPGPIDVVMP